MYRRLPFRGYVLSARVAALQVLLAAVSPVATPGIVRAIHWWFENMVSDVNALNSAAHNLRRRLAAEATARSAVAERTIPVECQRHGL